VLALATGLLGLALVIGAGAAVAALRRTERRSPAWLAATHAAVAVAGYGLLVVALHGPRRGQETGTQSFGVVSAVLLGAALLVGLALLRTRLRKRPIAGMLVGTHASLAVAGFVILAVYALLG